MKIIHDPDSVYDMLSALRFCTRFQRHRTIWPINVAEHSALVSQLTDCLIGAAIEWMQWNGYVQTAEDLITQRAEIVRMALWHDGLECFTTDIPRDIKNKFTRAPEGGAALGILEDDAARIMSSVIGAEIPIGKLTGIPRLFVKMADGMELILYCLTEQRAGNDSIMAPAHWIWKAIQVGKLLDHTIDNDAIMKWYAEAVHSWHEALGTRFSAVTPTDYLTDWRR